MVGSEKPKSRTKAGHVVACVIVIVILVVGGIGLYASLREPTVKFEDAIVDTLAEQPESFQAFRAGVLARFEPNEGELWHLDQPSRTYPDYNAIKYAQRTEGLLGSAAYWYVGADPKSAKGHYGITLDGGGGGWGGGDPRGSFYIFVDEKDRIVGWQASKQVWREAIIAKSKDRVSR